MVRPDIGAPRNSFRRSRFGLLGIAAVALALRIAHLFSLHDSPLLAVLVGDGRQDKWAREIAAVDWIGQDVLYQSPL